jgi:glyoxylase-like metal-dependent hydrolase (beta-lactamase superfamily II)
MGKLHKRSVGHAELVALQDSWFTVPPDELFNDLEEGAWDAYPQQLNDEGHLTLSLTTWLIRSEGRTILVDTGLGGRPSDLPAIDTPAMPSVLEEAGVAAQDVDVVVFTHLHFDHTGWNTVDRGGKPTPLFPNARHLIQQAEWDYWTTGNPEFPEPGPDRRLVLDPLIDAGLVDFVEGEHPVTREVVTLPTPGHTPAHVSFLLTSGGESVVVLGDAAHSPAQLPHPEWSCFADADKPLARQTRKALWDRSETEGTVVAANHFPFPGLGRAVRVDGAQQWEPL